MLKLLLPIITAIADHENATPEHLARMTEDELDREVKFCQALGSLVVLAQAIDPANTEYDDGIIGDCVVQTHNIGKLRMQKNNGPQETAVGKYDPELIDALFFVHERYEENCAKAAAQKATPSPTGEAKPLTPSEIEVINHVLHTLPPDNAKRDQLLQHLQGAFGSGVQDPAPWPTGHFTPEVALNAIYRGFPWPAPQNQPPTT